MKFSKHLLTGQELTIEQIEKLLELSIILKKSTAYNAFKHSLQGKYLALLFDKPSLRTRMSFTLAMKQLGGDVIESVGNTRQSESAEDLSRVLNGYCHAVVVRSHEDEFLEKMSAVSSISILNGLSELHHPCQILSDMMTLCEIFGVLKNLTVAYIGDGNNVLNSMLLLFPQMGVHVHVCCPASRQPNSVFLEQAQSQGGVTVFTDPIEAVVNVDAVYTDKWTSMGFEENTADHLFEGFQINESLMSHAKKDAVFMHCMPMARGKEVNESLPDSGASVIFRQSENRLHMQKSLLLHLLGGV